MQELQLHVEVALQQALEAAAMTCLVLCHLVDGIMDCIQVQGLCLLGQVHLAGACTALSSARIIRFFLVLSVTTSPSSSAKRDAWSASS